MDLIFTALSIKRFIYLLIVMSGALLAQHEIGGAQSHWIVWSAFALSLIQFGNTFSRRIMVLGATGVLLAITVLLTGGAASFTLLLAVYLSVITGIGMYLVQRYPNYFFPVFLIMLFAVVSVSNLPTATSAQFILIGTLIAGLPQILFWPYFVRNELQAWMMLTLRSLLKLQQEIFTCFLTPSYPENIYLHERRLHVKKTQYLHSISQLREFIKLSETKKIETDSRVLTAFANQSEVLYGMLIDCALLRIRVGDYTVLSVCAEELTAIGEQIHAIFSDMMAVLRGKRYHINTQGLNEKIERFEDTYHHVLQIAAQDPLVFALFIASLKSLQDEMNSLYSVIVKAREKVR
ncbi:FUSC family protein [Aquicella lusitana]|uniref:Fusaric acid resistance family protein n=1 Tax=Aquicella lusitana TaxID=254246 RepID=A0A370GKH0_9COXI|nr:hypothetical protein [Aquicella lusitana]RDI42433.1 hypothetical protein C8D86_11536 [Aquicella lusitana]VVC74105.1 hypothetical protein AQULUS_18700 [Aquicella lusitana]